MVDKAVDEDMIKGSAPTEKGFGFERLQKLLHTIIEVEYLDFDEFHMRYPNKTTKCYKITELHRLSKEMKQFDKISSIKIKEQ